MNDSNNSSSDTDSENSQVETEISKRTVNVVSDVNKKKRKELQKSSSSDSISPPVQNPRSVKLLRTEIPNCVNMDETRTSKFNKNRNCIS
jgi:hypothetical protein